MQITIPNGNMRTNRASKLALKASLRALKAKAFVHENLPANLLSFTPIVELLGPYYLKNEEPHC